MHRNINEVEFTIFDTETTGLEPESGDRIVEIAGVRVKGKEKIAEFQALVNPHRPVSSAAFEVNKITPDMLKDAPEPSEVLPKFLDFIQGTCICSYNAAFDVEFLKNELKLIGRDFPKNEVVDILKMSRRIMPMLERHSLWFVSQRLGIKASQMHRALSDVELTLEVFNKFNEMLEAKGVTGFKNFLGLFGLNSRSLDDINNQKIAEIQEAINLGVKIKIKYLSSIDASVTEREVTPKEIRKERGRDYLVGFCSLRNQERTFRIDGILHIEVV